ncbi:major facilitator superfamily domain-containing protein [Crepidotus variabilis]|uniref:Lysosomal dipeptide transporter MFSD1 n=1 Tax=Crepidotus variabilis TaxID=179855 RepID=A0A9P6ECL3_9AGAR|nr:major facilitator superfamily domain-containing protein [Crepidotus variabilis]
MSSLQNENLEETGDHLRDTCTHLLQTSRDDADSEQDVVPPAEAEGLLGSLGPEDRGREDAEAEWLRKHKRQTRKAFLVRSVALLCACSLSVGSHYATNILGPLKSRLHREIGTSHTEFGLLLSAYSLNSTWTPLLGGILASRLGTTFMSILATGIILLGQIFLLMGDMWGNVRFMALGLFIFGLGVSPLAVVQETLIVRFFKSHGLGVSMALGLVAGKGASFVSARTTYPLTERFGPRAPFYVATSLAALSVIINLVYISLSKWLIDGAGAELEAPDISEEARRRLAISISEGQALEKVAKKRQVHLRQITKLGDVFWAYIAFNVFCGMIWSPFVQLSANIIETRYKLSEEDAANTASYLLSGSIILYPLVGYVVDSRKNKPIVLQLLFLSSTLTLLSFIWLASPPGWTHTPIPSIITFAAGHGFSPLLLVVIVPKIVPSNYVSTALGAHKSLEQTGSVLLQTLSGLLLDTKAEDKKATSFQRLLDVFVFINVCQGAVLALLTLLQYRKDELAGKAPQFPFSPSHSRSESARLSTASAEIETPLLSGITPDTSTFTKPRTQREIERDKAEMRRGKIIAWTCVGLVISAWVLFMTVAWQKLGKKEKK